MLYEFALIYEDRKVVVDIKINQHNHPQVFSKKTREEILVLKLRGKRILHFDKIGKNYSSDIYFLEKNSDFGILMTRYGYDGDIQININGDKATYFSVEGEDLTNFYEYMIYITKSFV